MPTRQSLSKCVGTCVLVCCLGFLVYFVDKSNEPKTNPSSNGTVQPSKQVKVKSVVPESKPALEGWPKPAIALILSGQQNGYVEPCGCTEGQLGGMARRADLIDQIEAKGWKVAGFDLGGAVKRSRRQSQIKFETMLGALSDMKYGAIALGPQELLLDPVFLLITSRNLSDNNTPLPFLGANVVFSDFTGLKFPAAQHLLTVGNVKIGVTAVVEKGLVDKVLLKGSSLAKQISIKEPDEVLPDVIKKLKQYKPDLMVLLSHLRLQESRKLAKKFPDFDLILSTGIEDPDGKPEFVGNTLLVTVGRKGKYAGVVGYYPNDKKHRLRFELVHLDQDRFQEAAKMVEHMRTYQNRLREERIVFTEPPIAHPSGATYVGAEKCGDCHTKAFKKWKRTKHSHAFESLERARKGHKDHGITRVFDAECLTCHVTGWYPENVLRYKSGFLNQKFAETEEDKRLSPLLRGVQCENCHGPGSRHVELIESEIMDDLIAAKKEMRVTLKTAKKTLCYSCHDLDNSPHFDFEKYWKRIQHPGLD